MKKVLILTVLLASVPVLGFSQTAYTVNNAAAWTQAVNGIRNGGNNKEYAITVTGAVSVPPAPNNVNTFGSVTGVTVTIAGNGTLSPSGNGCLLQIGARQTVVARDLTLRGRSANNASVVDIASGGTFRMEGNATVSGNTEANRNGIGGGVYVDGNFIMQDRASVKDNTARNKNGGGVYVGEGGTLTMRGSASVSGNTAGNNGGGVYINGGTFTMQDSASVSGNTASDFGGGGGVLVDGGTFIMRDNASVSGNTASDFGGGGGVSVWGGTFAMQGNAQVSDNTAGKSSGGGVYVSSGTFTMRDTTSVSGNTSYYSVYNEGTFTMQGSASVSGNIGGGVTNSGTFTMKGGTISGNTGAGVYVIRPGDGGGAGTFIMEGGIISGNTGGGVVVGAISGLHGNLRGTFIKTGGTIYGDDADQNFKNTVITRLGSAVYDEGNGRWRNTTAGPTMNTDSLGFWLNDGDVVIFPSGFAETWERSNSNNTLTVTQNTMNSSSSDYVWVLQSISDNTYTLKRADAANTKTLTIRLDRSNLVISGDSGSGEDNWNGTWRELEW